MIEVAKNGVTDSTILSSISNAKTIDEAISAASPHLKTASTDVVKLDNGNTILIDKNTGKVIQSYGGSKDTENSTLSFVGDYNSYKKTAIAAGQTPVDAETYNEKVKAKNTAIQTILGSSKFTAEQKKDLVASINNGEDAFSVIKNQTKNIMGQTLATALDKNEQTRDAMLQLQDSLQSFYKAGGDTDILTGNFEKVVNKLGEVNKPELVDLAVQIASSLQKYRNAISGTAYSEQEGKDIASIFPGINKGEILNSTIVKARLKTISSDIDSAYRNTLGNAYDSLKNSEKSNADLVKEAEDAKAQVNTFWQKSDKDTQDKIMSLFNNGYNDIDVIDYLKAKQLIK
jgi:hypothetical protein